VKLGKSSLVAGPGLAHSLTELGLIDAYRICPHPVVVGQGKSYFAGPRPPRQSKIHSPYQDTRDKP